MSFARNIKMRIVPGLALVQEAARRAEGIITIVPGPNITVDASDPKRPVISSTGGGAGGGGVSSVNGQTGDVSLTAMGLGAATVIQGAKADTALQPGGLAKVATSGVYNDLTGRPTLGTAAASKATDFAVAARGLPAGGTTGQVLAKASAADYDTQWVPLNDGGGSGSLQLVLPNLLDFGGNGNGIASNNTALTAAKAAGPMVYVPPGTYATTLASTALPRLEGLGQVQDANGKRGRYFAEIVSRPTALGNHNSVLTAFGGDLSKVLFPIEYRISGEDTLGKPASGYLYTPEASAVYLKLHNKSGWNQDTASNEGRTSATAMRVTVMQQGQGDCVAYNFSGFVMGEKPGATNFLANPAASGLNGEIMAGGDHVYLNPIEINCDGQSYDVAGVAFVTNMHRNNDTRGKNEIWGGFRVQSVGTKPIDSIIMGTGPIRVGIDLVHATYSSAAAIAIKGGDRIYLNATQDPTSIKSRPVFGDDYIAYTNNRINFVVGNQPVLQMTSTGAVIAGDLDVTGTIRRNGVVVT